MAAPAKGGNTICQKSWFSVGKHARR